MGSLGFTGTAEGMSFMQSRTVDSVLRYLRPTEVHHGDCIGSDARFHLLASHVPCEIHIHPPTNPRFRAWCAGGVRHPHRPYLDRNQDIVDSSDVLIATPRGFRMEHRSGTWATVRRARKAGLVIVIVYPDGSTAVENA